jgi:hypothetical protein
VPRNGAQEDLRAGSGKQEHAKQQTGVDAKKESEAQRERFHAFLSGE